MTLLHDGVYTVLPYTAETLHSTNKRIALAETVGTKKREVFQEVGSAISGCFVTLITATNMRELLKLITTPEETFDILMNRGTEKVIYKDLHMKAFELRGQDDENITLKIDIKETDLSYTEAFSQNTPDLTWNSEKTLRYTDYDFASISENAIKGIYRFSFTGNFEKAASYTLQVHSPVMMDSLLASDVRVDELNLHSSIMTEDDTVSLTITFTDLFPYRSLGGSDTFGEQLMYRLYQIDGSITIEERGNNTYFGATL